MVGVEKGVVRELSGFSYTSEEDPVLRAGLKVIESRCLLQKHL